MLSKSAIHGLPPCMRVTFSSTVFGAICGRRPQTTARSCRVLIGHQAHAHLGHRHGRQHGLRAVTGEAAEQPVHFEGRPPTAFVVVNRLAEQLRRASSFWYFRSLHGSFCHSARSSGVNSRTSS